jgi:hypothetical protein
MKTSYNYYHTGRYIAVIGGWGPDSDNKLNIIDSSALIPTATSKPRLQLLSAETINCPRFRYGFTANTVSENRVLCFGGLRQGGYAGEVADLYYIHFHFLGGVATSGIGSSYSDRLVPCPSSLRPTARGYHTSTIVQVDGKV